MARDVDTLLEAIKAMKLETTILPDAANLVTDQVSFCLIELNFFDISLIQLIINLMEIGTRLMTLLNIMKKHLHFSVLAFE